MCCICSVLAFHFHHLSKAVFKSLPVSHSVGSLSCILTCILTGFSACLYMFVPTGFSLCLYFSCSIHLIAVESLESQVAQSLRHAGADGYLENLYIVDSTYSPRQDVICACTYSWRPCQPERKDARTVRRHNLFAFICRKREVRWIDVGWFESAQAPSFMTVQ